MTRLAPAAVADALFDFRLRPSQHQAVDAVVGGRDALAVLPDRQWEKRPAGVLR